MGIGPPIPPFIRFFYAILRFRHFDLQLPMPDNEAIKAKGDVP